MKLWAHQQEAANFAAPREGTLLALDMGTGKTLTSLYLADLWGANRILVTCPLSVVGVWPHEVQKHSPGRWEVARCDVGSVGRKTCRAKDTLARANPSIVVVNHEAVWRKPFATLVRNTPWDLLIVDECHRAKSPGGKLSLFLSWLRADVPRRLGLTGTPLPHSPLDAYAQARFLDPSVFGYSFVRFKDRYTDTYPIKLRDGRQVKKIVGYRNQEEFEAKLGSMMHRVTKAEAIDLPPEIDVSRLCQLEPKARRIYDDMESSMYAAHDAGELKATNALTQLLRLQQLTGGSVPDEDGRAIPISSAKVKLLEDVLTDILDPVVVFCRFRAELESLRALVGRLKRNYHEVSGRARDLTDGGRMLDDADIMGVQIQAGGVGIDLTRASTAIYYSFGWSLGDLLQARARVHRPGQARPVTHIHLLAEDTVDQSAYWALKNRADMVEGVLERAHRRTA